MKIQEEIVWRLRRAAELEAKAATIVGDDPRSRHHRGVLLATAKRHRRAARALEERLARRRKK